MNNLRPNHHDVKFFDEVKMTRSSKFDIEDYNDKSPINSFWDGYAQLLIAGIYYTIALLFILFGDATVGYIIGSCALTCNLVWFGFKGWKLVWKWFINLPIA